MTEPNIYDIARGQDVLIERVVNLKDDLNNKHKQNRDSIHSINGKLDEVINQMWMLKLKIVGYASGAGVLTGALIKLLDHIWKT